MRSRWILAMALALTAPGLCPSTATAETLYVAKDGTGHFDVIQDAIDAAAAGDTIRIGAGRYAEFREFAPPEANGAIIALVQTPDLALIGAHRDSVVIGPVEWTQEINQLRTAGVLTRVGTGGIQLSNVTIENVYEAAFVAVSGQVDNVRFRNVDAGVSLLDTDGAVIEDCDFEWTVDRGEIGGGVVSFVGHTVHNTTIRRCRFTQVDNKLGGGITLDDGSFSIVEDCEFTRIGVGVLVTSGSDSVRVRNCTFVEGGNKSIKFAEFSSGWIEDSTFINSRGAAIEISASHARINRCSINGGGDLVGAINLRARLDVIMRDCDIVNIPASNYHVLAQTLPDFTDNIDLRWNHWSSTDSTEIAGWINDGADDEAAGECEYFWACPRDAVDFWPVLEQSVSGGKRSVSGLKHRFGKRD